MKEEIIGRGAEATLIKKGNILVKKRFIKSYRLPIIDEKLRKQRTKKETKLLEKASKLIPVPNVIKSSDIEKEIDMEFLPGKKLSEHLDSLPNAKEVCIQIGKNIAKLHNAGIIHGDLTTSNMILKDKKVYFIDFGLGFESGKIEDKAVDLHLIKEALEARHFKHFESLFNAVLEGYKSSKYAKETLSRLEKVEKRGRYKEQY